MICNTPFIISISWHPNIIWEKSEVMAFCGKEPVPSNISLNDKMIEKTNDFIYLGYKLSFQGETDLPQKITKKQNHVYHK
jgi:hypothetical protein